MAQTLRFYQIHNENGRLFKSLIIDSDLWDSKIGYPISQMTNESLLSLYKSCIIAKRQYKAGEIYLQTYLDKKSEYYKHLPAYHTKRT